MKRLEHIGEEILQMINDSESLLIKSRLQEAHNKLMSANDIMSYSEKDDYGLRALCIKNDRQGHRRRHDRRINN